MERIVVVGAGPAGLLATIFLLNRSLQNRHDGQKKYHVTLVDPGIDHGRLDTEELKKHRSWMIGLSAHGLDAVSSVPGLYEDYVKGLGIMVDRATIGIGPNIKFNIDVKETHRFLIVDRNHICAALARYINDHFVDKVHQDGTKFTAMYETSGLLVDYENKCLWTREVTSSTTQQKPKSIPYDWIIGCDGIRSVVRNAFLTHHWDFEFDIKGTYQTGKSLHIDRPSSVSEGNFMILANCVPNMTAFVLSETGGKLNFAIGMPLSKTMAPELESTDPKVVTEYFRKHFKTIPDMNFEQLGAEWAGSALTTVRQTHANFYHSMKLSAVLMGDAAHATIPNIGQGMNTALADAAVLNNLLDEYKGDFAKVLPAFSQERVKEGNALTDLSFHSFSLSPVMQMRILLGQFVRSTLNMILPYWLCAIEPMGEISRGGKLSVAYDRMVKLGFFPRNRLNNERIMREHFEKSVGMVTAKEGGVGQSWWTPLLVGGISLFAAFFYHHSF